MWKLVYFALLVCLVTGCYQEKHPKEDLQTLRLNIGTEPPVLDGRKAIDTTSAIVLKMLFDGLTRLSPNGKSRPSTALSITISDDLKTYTFRLRETFWSNGDPLRAQDFEYAWKWILDPKNPADYAYQLYVIKNAKAAKMGQLPLDSVGIHSIDDKTLVVELENPTPYFLELTSLMPYYPINKKMDEAKEKESKGQLLISNGPFYLASWKHDDEIVVEKSKHYWDAASVKLNRIHLFMIADPNTELSLFQQKELDWAGTPLSTGLPVDAISELKRLYKLHIKPEAATYFYELNTSSPPLSNKKVRQALAYAINRKAIVDNITQANQIPATSLLPPPLAVGSNNYFPDGNIKQARRLFQEGLAELKMSKKTFPPLTISYNTNEGHRKIAEAIQQQLQEALGIQIALENKEWKVYLDQLRNGNYQIGRMTWIADFNDPISFLGTFKYRSNSANNTYWENPSYIALLDAAALEKNHVKRQEILRQAERLLLEEMPIIPIYFLMNSYLKNPKLQNVYLSGLGDVDFKWAYFEE